MAIYFGRSASAGNFVAERVKELGLSLIRASVADSHPLSIPHDEQPGYASYQSNIPAFMTAYETKKDTTLYKRGYPIAFDINKAIKMGFPTVVVFPGSGKNFSLDITNRFQELGGELVKMSGKTGYKIRVPSVTVAREVLAVEYEKDTAVIYSNTCSPEGLRVFMLLTRIISLFLQTHQYPGHYSNGDTSHRSVWDVVAKAGSKRTREADAEASGAKKRRVEGNTEDTVMENEEEEESSLEEELTVRDPDNLLRAKRPLKENHNPWGPVASVPAMSGLFFPYISELANPDFSLVLGVIRSFFIKCLGRDTESIHATWHFVSRYWYKVHATEQGTMMAHLFAVASMSITGQALCYPIIDGGVYIGACMLGAKFSVSLSGSVYTPVEWTLLSKLLNDIESHAVILTKIRDLYCERLSPENKGKMKKIEEITTMRVLYEELGRIAIPIETRNKVSEMARKLSFQERSWPVGRNTMEQVLRAIKTWKFGGDAAQVFKSGLPNTAPMSSEGLKYERGLETILSVFGNYAPSPCVAGGRRLILGDEADFVGKADLKDKLAIGTKQIREAVKDWEVMISTGVIMNKPEGRSAGSRDMVFEGADRVALCALMKELVVPKDVKRLKGKIIPSSSSSAVLDF